MKILTTWGAGLISFAVIRLAISRRQNVFNLDALHYAACLESLTRISDHPNCSFVKMNIRNRKNLNLVLSNHKPDWRSSLNDILTESGVI